MNAIYGITRATFIYHQSMYLLIRANLGASADQPDSTWPEMSRAAGEFHRYLAAQGVDINTFVNATGEWMNHFQSDLSGKAMADYQAEVFQLRGRQPRPTAAEYEQLSRSGQTEVHTGSAAGADAIYGVTMEMLAEFMTKDGELRTKFGDQQGRTEMDTFLASRGLDSNVWALAHNAWHDRFKADPTGRTEAQFHMILAQLSQKAHFADVRDMTQDVQGGITLDVYAQITVAVGKPGADANAIVAQHGLDMAGWQAANAAWTHAMSQDTDHKLTMQYGALYQKHSGPAYQEQMLAQTAAILAAANAPRDVIDEPQEELTPDLCLQKMKSPSRNERWRYARLYANMADLGNVPDKVQAIATVTPILIDMLDQLDDDTVSDAESAIGKLWDLGVRGDDLKGYVARCLNRAREQLVSLQAAFAPIQDKAVPERVTLQSRIQDYQSLVETLTDYMGRDWKPEEESPPARGHAAMPMGAPAAMPMAASMGAASAGGGFPKWILAPVILVVVGGGIFVAKGALSGKGSAPSTSASPSASAHAPAASANAHAAPASAASTAPRHDGEPAPSAAPKAAPKKKTKKP